MSPKPGPPPHHVNNSYVSLHYVLFLGWEKQVAKAFFHSQLLCFLRNTVYLCRNIKVTQSRLLENPFRLLQSFHSLVAQSGNGGGCPPPVSLLGWWHQLQLVIVRPPSVMAQQYWTVRRLRHCFRKVCKLQGMCRIVCDADV